MKYLIYWGTIYHSEYAVISDEKTTEGAEPLTEVFKRSRILVGNDPKIDAQRLADITGEDVTTVKLQKETNIVEHEETVHPSP